MNNEQKYNAALEQAKKELKTCGSMDCDAARLIFRLFPQLRESEDERIRKMCIAAVNIAASADGGLLHSEASSCLAWLEKQKEEEGYEAIPIESTLEYKAGKHAGFLEGLNEGRKQKESLHIPETRKENADSFADEHPNIIDSEMGEEFAKQKEQNGEDEECTDFTIYHPLKNGKGEYKCIPYSFYGSLTSFSEDKDLIDFLRTCFYTEEECNEWIKQQKEQKTVAISENNNSDANGHLTGKILVEYGAHAKVRDGKRHCEMDWKEFQRLAHYFYELGKTEQQPVGWSEKDIERMVDKRAKASGTTKAEIDFYRQGIKDTLKSLRPSWKPARSRWRR